MYAHEQGHFSRGTDEYNIPHERPLGQLRFGGCGVGAKRGLVAAQSVFLTALREVSCVPQRCIRIQKKLGFTPGKLNYPPSGSLGGTRLVGGARSTSAAFELGEQVRRVASDQVSRDELRTDAPTRVWENPLILYPLIRFFRCDYRAVKWHTQRPCAEACTNSFWYPLFFPANHFPPRHPMIFPVHE